MRLGARVFWVTRNDMGDLPPQVRVHTGTLLSRQEDVTAVIVGTVATPHPDFGEMTLVRGCQFFDDTSAADSFAVGMAHRLVSNFKFKRVDVFLSGGKTQTVGEPDERTANTVPLPPAG